MYVESGDPFYDIIHGPNNGYPKTAVDVNPDEGHAGGSPDGNSQFNIPFSIGASCRGLSQLSVDFTIFAGLEGGATIRADFDFICVCENPPEPDPSTPRG